MGVVRPVFPCNTGRRQPQGDVALRLNQLRFTRLDACPQHSRRTALRKRAGPGKRERKGLDAKWRLERRANGGRARVVNLSDESNRQVKAIGWNPCDLGARRRAGCSLLKLSNQVCRAAGKRLADLRGNEQPHGIQFAPSVSQSPRIDESTQILHRFALMTMVRFSREDRRFVAEAVREIANLAAAAMVFGQFVVDRSFSPLIALGGILVWFGFMAFAIVLRTRKR